MSEEMSDEEKAKIRAALDELDMGVSKRLSPKVERPPLDLMMRMPNHNVLPRPARPGTRCTVRFEEGRGARRAMHYTTHDVPRLKVDDVKKWLDTASKGERKEIFNYMEQKAAERVRKEHVTEVIGIEEASK